MKLWILLKSISVSFLWLAVTWWEKGCHFTSTTWGSISRTPTWPPLAPWEERGATLLLGRGEISGSLQARPALTPSRLGGEKSFLFFPLGFCWGRVKGLVASGWWCKFGCPLSLLKYTWLGQGGAPPLQVDKDRSPDSSFSLSWQVVYGLLNILLHKWTGIGLMELYTKGQISPQIPISWDHFFYCSNMIPGCHSNVLWCFQFCNTKVSLYVLT